MGNVTIPTPVAVAGGALCLLGGYLIGVVAGPDTTGESTATVVSFDADTDELCLEGDAAAAVPAAEDGVLCGTWRHENQAPAPAEGAQFRFTTLVSSEDGQRSAVFIYGDVVR